MKKKKVNALLACLLAFSMAFSQPAAVLAQENASVSASEDKGDAITEDEKNEEGVALSGGGSTTENEDTENEQTPSDDGTKSGNEDSDNGQLPDIEDDSQLGGDIQTPDEEESPRTEDENDEDAQSPDEEDGSEAEDESRDDIQTPDDAEAGDDNADSDEISEEELKIEAQQNGVSVENQKKLNALGFKTMKLDQSMIMEKTSLSQVAKNMSSMKAGKDYIEGEVVYFADSEEEARNIAECYGGTVDEYSYGIAVADIEQSVLDAVEVAANMAIPIPAVYPNIVYTIAEDWDTSSIDTSEVTVEDIAEDIEDDFLWSDEDMAGEAQIYANSVSDPEYSQQWYHEAVNTLNAWGTSDASKGEGVTVAVLDTGVDYTHPDLKDNIKGHTSVLGANADDKDMNGHGTHCAGIIAAAENTVGGVGVAPKAGIYSIQVLDSKGAGNTSYTAMGLEEALKQNVDVVSMSLGSIYYDAVLQTTINKLVKKGIVVVAAAGNGDDLGYGVSQKTYPAAYTGVIAVAATYPLDYPINSYGYYYLTEFSNYGTWVDIAAPGYGIYSTLPTYDYESGSTDSEGNIIYGTKDYGELSGTSMACPIVAGAVALMLANNSTLRNTNTKACVDRITKELLASADTNGAISWYYGGGNTYYNENDTRLYYPLINVEYAVYAVDDTALEMPGITFSTGAPDSKNVVKAGFETYFELTSKSEHDKIYYTINGKKPTASTGILYTGGVDISGYSGKTKIQAVAVRGSKTSKVFSKTYTFNVLITDMCPSGVKYESVNDIWTANMNVSIGKSIQLAVAVTPSNASNTKYTWTCTDSDGLIKVNKSGKVTCNKKATAGHSAVVTAEAQDGSGKKCQFNITAVSEKVETLTLNATSLTMSYFANEEGTAFDESGTKYVSYYQLVPTSNGAENNQYIYKSSNTKVAYVDSDGNVTALNKGKAKITVTANDGSGKKAVCSVTVVTPVFDIEYQSATGYYGWTGYDSTVIPIATGCSIKIKTILNHNNKTWAPSNKTLEWKSDSTMLTAKNGKITCSKNATPDTEINVTVSAKVGYGEDVTIKFIVIDKVEKIYIQKGSTQVPGLIWDNAKVGNAVSDPIYGTVLSDGSVVWLKIKTASGKTYDLYDYLLAYNKYGLVSVDVSNRDVVQDTWLAKISNRPEGFYLVATKPGSAKVNYVLNDGSKKKFTVSVKVSK